MAQGSPENPLMNPGNPKLSTMTINKGNEGPFRVTHLEYPLFPLNPLNPEYPLLATKQEFQNILA